MLLIFNAHYVDLPLVFNVTSFCFILFRVFTVLSSFATMICSLALFCD